MSIYDPLYKWLSLEKAKGIANISVTFDEIEIVLGFALPDSATKRPQWWANEAGHTRHVQSKAWLAAGYMTSKVDLSNKSVKFVRDDCQGRSKTRPLWRSKSRPVEGLLSVVGLSG
jgi:hypothetical protein